jgi:GntR family transcriptional regulator, transcriptional repressor for pyruvate dehydrogenase complex
VSDSPITLRPARTLRAVEDITQQIRGELRARRLNPGQRLPPERELAKQLGVSRNTVREAMSMLEVAGLLERRIGSAGGSFIARSNSAIVARGIADGMTLGRFTLANLAEARLALESFIARKACEHGKESEFDSLQANLQRTTAIPDDHWDRKLDAYREFLGLFIAAAHNPLLADLAQPLIDKTEEIVRPLGPSGTDRIVVIRRGLVRALRARDADAASRAVEEAIRHIYTGWLARADRAHPGKRREGRGKDERALAKA